MPALERVKCLVDIFNERFSRYDLTLTAEDVERGSGVIQNGDDGWPLDVAYRFGADADGEYLDYYFWYSYHQNIPDHIRIRADRRDADGAWITMEELTFEWRSNYDEALGAAMWLVDDALTGFYRHGMTADKLMSLYRSTGPDPYIRYEDRSLARAANPISAWFFIYQPIPFNAWGYAEVVSNRLCGASVKEPSLSLAGWQGRYDRYDKHRMEAQLFLDRKVRLTRDIPAGDAVIPAGSTGNTSEYDYFDSRDAIDYTRQVPVIFDQKTLPSWRRALNMVLGIGDRRETLDLAVPYDALEFVEGDTIYSANLDKVYAEIR